MQYCRWNNIKIELEEGLREPYDREMGSEEKENLKEVLHMIGDFLIEEEIINVDEDHYIEINDKKINEFIENL